jgi:hypothetical protein
LSGSGNFLQGISQNTGRSEMPETPANQSGGVSNTGTMNTGGGSVVGRDMTINTTTSTTSKMQIAFQPIADAVKEAVPAVRPAAEATLVGLRQEVEKAEKGEKADDSVIAGLVRGLVGLVPSAVSAVVSAFSSPILGAIAGPATQSFLSELGAGKV